MTTAAELKREFESSTRPHILMITNHGIHDWEIRSGLTDTGGQNQYVCALSNTLVELGFRVTTFNRGGFADPMTGEPRTGARYKDAFSRIVYLEDNTDEFIRKEDLGNEVLSEEADFACKFMRDEGIPVELIISHYWDGAVVANMIRERLKLDAKHVWVPHSLGVLKKDNFKDKPPEIVKPLKFDERIEFEKLLLPGVDFVASTSGDISRVMEISYGRKAELFLPPCIDTDKFHPLPDDADRSTIYDFLQGTDVETGGDVKGRTCVLEMSRTDRTKRKDIVVRAFAEALKDYPESKLLLRINPKAKDVYTEIMDIIEKLGIRNNVVLVGMVPDELMSQLFSVASVYFSPSEMEGFGMSVQEATACKRTVISSDLVPFAVEYLLEDATDENIETEDGSVTIEWGKGGAVVPAGKVGGFAHALKKLLGDTELRDRMAKGAYEITIPYFTWKHMTSILLEKVGIN